MQPIDLPVEVESIDVRRYLALFWHWSWLIVLIAILAGLSAFFISRKMTPTYEAKTTLLVNEAPSSQAADYTSVMTSERLTRTYSAMLTTTPVLNEVAKRLSLLEVDPETISVAPVRDTQLIEISVQSANPLVAAKIANTLVEVFTEQLRVMLSSRFSVSKESLQDQLADIQKQIESAVEQASTSSDQAEKDRLQTTVTQYRQIYAGLLQSYEQVRLAEAESTSTVTQVEPATPPDEPVSPRTMMNTLLATVVGLMLAMGAIFTIDALDDTLKTPDEIARELDLPTLAYISHFNKTDKGRAPITESDPRSPVAESFRELRTMMQYASGDKPLRTILVTSPLPGEGKTTIITNLAVVMAQSGLRVALLDADMRRPTIHQRLELSNRLGLSAILAQPEPRASSALQKTSVYNLSVITSGSTPPNPSELLGSQKMNGLLDQIHETQDIVLLDTPPILAVTDAAVLATDVDGVLLVMKPGVARRKAARYAVEQLHRVGANLLGVVINDLKSSHSHYGYYNYRKDNYYGSYYGHGEIRRASYGSKTRPRDSVSTTDQEA